MIDTFSTNAFYFAVILGVLSKFLRRPYITILRGGDLPTRLMKSPRLTRLLFKNSETNVSPSLFLQHEFQHHGFQTKYIPNFIEIEKYPFKRRETISPKILWVRSFHHIYNPLLAITILEKLREKYPNAKLCMVGPDKDGSMQITRELIGELGIENHVKMTGKLEKSAWIELSKQYDIFLNTTNFDNHPVSVIEAMALGLPIVSTNVGGIPFLLKDKKEAILITKQSTGAAVDAIEKIMQEKLSTQKMIENARKKSESFSWEKVEITWSQIIDQFV